MERPIYEIPFEFQGYPEGQPPEPMDADLIYFPRINEQVNVLRWERYPDYDFIFGIPDKASPRYEKEIAFFGFRRGERTNGHYYDVLETLCMAEAFARILKESRSYSPHLWQSSPEKK